MNQNLTPFAARIERKSLADALKVMAKIIEKRNSIPILSCLMLEPGQDCVTVRGTDLDIHAVIQLPADCLPGPAVCVNAATLKDATGKAKGEFITLSDTGNNRVSFRDGETGAAMSLPSLPAADFPLPQGKLAGSHDLATVPAAQLLADLKRLSIAVSTEEARYYLNGIFWHLVDGELRMAATDGHRMTRIARPAPAGLPEEFPDAILPRKTCDVLASIMAKPGTDSIRLGFTGATAVFRYRHIELRSKLIDGSFPDYSRIIPSSFTRRLTIPAATLGDAVKAVTAHVSGKTRMVQIGFDPEAGWLTVSARCDDNGPAAMQVEGADIEALGKIAYSGSDDGTGTFSMACNAAYLAQLLAPFGDDPVTISIQDAVSPMRITAAAQPEYLQVLMAMRDGGAAVTPASIAKMNQSPLEAFEADAPAHVQAIAEIEASEGLTPSAKRLAVRSHARDLAHLIRGAIAHLASTVAPAPVPMSRFAEMTVGGKMKPVPLMDGRRRAARLIILSKLEAMRDSGGSDAFYRYVAMLDTKGPRSSYLKWERGLSGTMPETHRLQNTSPAETETALYARHGKLPDPALPVISGDDDDAEAQPVEAPAPAPMPSPAEAAPMPEPEPVAANDDGNQDDSPPMFRTLQDFKAAAGVGSRWILSNHNPQTGWGGERLVTVATVKARDLGFLRGEATPEQLADASRAKGHSGRTWIGFPKQGQWESTPEGLVILYRDGSPCMKVVPAPALADLAQPVAAEGQPQEVAPDNAALLDLVATLVARIERLETALQTRDAKDGGMDVEGPESLPAPASAENIGDLVAMVPLSDLEDVRERAVRAELRADGLQHDLADMEERAIKAEGIVAALRTRIGRMGLVLAGRKAQLAAVGRDLLFARSKAAQMARDAEAKPKPVATIRGEGSYSINARKAS